jgi:Flp pilus assembly secretin CpaC
MKAPGRPFRFRSLTTLVLAVAALGGLLAGPAPAQPQELRLYVTVDKAELVTLPGERVSTVAVTNPKVADVQVITPSQILVIGKTLGVTSLVVFYPRNQVQFFDLVVHPAPVVALTTPVSNPAPHTVLVHRADRLTSQLFVRDDAHAWVELGKARPETTDEGKK